MNIVNLLFFDKSCFKNNKVSAVKGSIVNQAILDVERSRIKTATVAGKLKFFLVRSKNCSRNKKIRMIVSFGTLERKIKTGDKETINAARNLNFCAGLNVEATKYVNQTIIVPIRIKGSLTPKSDLPNNQTPIAAVYEGSGNW